MARKADRATRRAPTQPRGVRWYKDRVSQILHGPHAVRRLRHRAWAKLGQEMRLLQHALLWA